MGKPCVCGCEAVKVDYEQQLFTVGSTAVRKGELISIDGTTGQVILGAVPLKDPELSKEYQTILEWADEVRTLQVGPTRTRRKTRKSPASSVRRASA